MKYKKNTHTKKFDKDSYFNNTYIYMCASYTFFPSIFPICYTITEIKHPSHKRKTFSCVDVVLQDNKNTLFGHMTNHIQNR